MLEKYKKKKDGEDMPPLDSAETVLKIPSVAVGLATSGRNPLVDITLAEKPESGTSPTQEQVIKTIIPILQTTRPSGTEAEKDKLIVSILPLT